MVGLNTLKFMDNDPYVSNLLLSRLTTSLSSDTGTIVDSAADTLTGKFVIHVIFWKKYIACCIFFSTIDGFRGGGVGRVEGAVALSPLFWSF